jgi:hypothetical protein
MQAVIGEICTPGCRRSDGHSYFPSCVGQDTTVSSMLCVPPTIAPASLPKSVQKNGGVISLMGITLDELQSRKL